MPSEYECIISNGKCLFFSRGETIEYHDKNVIQMNNKSIDFEQWNDAYLSVPTPKGRSNSTNIVHNTVLIAN